MRYHLLFALVVLVGCSTNKTAGTNDASVPTVSDAGKRGASGQGGRGQQQPSPKSGTGAGAGDNGSGSSGSSKVPPVIPTGGVSAGASGMISAAGVGGMPDDRDAGMMMPSDAGKPPSDGGKPPVVTDYTMIADQACMMAGGTCVAHSQCAPSVGNTVSLICRPGVPGLTCCHMPANCPGSDAASCCRFENGKVASSSGADCDRGYPSCLGYGAEYSLFADKACTMKLAEPTETSTNNWPGATSAHDAGKWACEQIGGELNPDASCDGYPVVIGPEACCIPRDRCPEAKTGTECCHFDGKVVTKECVNGAAICNTTLVGLGDVREVASGSCQAFMITH
jgi:hypothetical protein